MLVEQMRWFPPPTITATCIKLESNESGVIEAAQPCSTSEGIQKEASLAVHEETAFHKTAFPCHGFGSFSKIQLRVYHLAT
jgi:hypothetical protein